MELTPGVERCAGVELSVDTLAGALAADRLGARRIELCSAGALGGLTPGPGLLAGALAGCRSTEVHVLVRPRDGGFRYSSAEVDVMATDVAHAVAAGAAGVVVGALTRHADPDRGALAELVAAAAGRPVGFHRALDVCRDPLDAVERLVELGVRRVLSSGQAARAEDGIGVLAALAGDRLVITACGGIRAHNAVEVLRASGVGEVHAAPRVVPVEQPPIAAGGVDFGAHAELDVPAAAALIAAVNRPR
ncbi:MAG TPA: copper homeostasis protein CutC [Pseudonocardia sp.]|uniref:copper homeostasis protein CutC n=1 Tax=Pseudonocardia sp. TaxID=60912 RepID=UPI002B9AB367|nr:copper homeostasis protein CutC [Pseudonocardia sp.]HTF54311.1 copper homeostasis protein CutC [Pseudonocardia sp.]